MAHIGTWVVVIMLAFLVFVCSDVTSTDLLDRRINLLMNLISLIKWWRVGVADVAMHLIVRLVKQRVY